MKFKKLSESFSNYMRCPHCTNMTLMPVDGYDDLFICDDCGEELKGILQYDGSYKFKPYNEDDELNESDNTNETWLGFTIECDIGTDLDSDVFDLNWETNQDYFDAIRDEAVDKLLDAVNSVEGCSGATMDDWDFEKNSNWGSIDYTFDGNFTCTRENVDLKALQAEIDAALRNIQSHTTTETLYDGSYTTNYVPYGERMVSEGDYLNDVDMKVRYDYDTECTSVYRISEDGYPIKESVNNPEFVICVFDGDDNRWKMWGGTHTAPEEFNKEEFLARVNNQEFPNLTVINNYTDAKIIPNNGAEYRKLTEGNELENRAKKHRKHQDGLSPFCYLSESVYKSGDKYYGGLPAEPDMNDTDKKGLYWVDIVQYFKENVYKHPGYKILGYSPSTIVLQTPTGKEYLDLCHFDALSGPEEAVEMASHLFESKKKKKYNFNPNAGDVELSSKMFNNMMNSAESPNTNPVSGPFGGDVGASDASGCCESATLEFRAVNNPEFVDMTHDDLFNKVLHKYIKVENRDTGATLDILVDSVDVDGAGVCGHPVQPKDSCKAAKFDYYPKEYIVGWSSAPVSKLNEATESNEERFAFFFPYLGGPKIMNRERAVRQLEFELDNFKNDSGASLAGRGFALYCLESIDDDGTSWIGRYDTKEFLKVLNESGLSESVTGSIDNDLRENISDCLHAMKSLAAKEDYEKISSEYDKLRTLARKLPDESANAEVNELIDDFMSDLSNMRSALKTKNKKMLLANIQDSLQIFMEFVDESIINKERIDEAILHDMPDGRYQAVRFNWSHEEVTLTCYDKEADEEFDKWICAGVYDEDTGRRTALKLLKDPAFEIPQDIKNELISTYGLDDFGYKIEEAFDADKALTRNTSASEEDQKSEKQKSIDFPYMFFYSCNNPAFGYDFQLFASSLGAQKVYGRYKGTGSGTYFYLVPSEEVYNKLKAVAKDKYTVEMQRLLPYDAEKYPKVQYIKESFEMAVGGDDFDGEIAAMRREQAELEARRAARKARFALYHKLFDDKVAEDENAPWIDRVHTMFDEATEIQVVSDPSKVPSVVDGQKVSYKFSVDEIDIFADAYRDYLYIVTTK